MVTSLHSGQLGKYINLARRGFVADIDAIMNDLNADSSLATTRFIDFALSLVKNEEGIKRLEYYLFNGNLTQRNYCSLYFNRNYEFPLVLKAYKLGLIDEIQAFAR